VTGKFILFNLFTEFKSVHLRHHDITDDQVWQILPGNQKPLLPVLGQYHIITVAHLIVKKLLKIQVIFHHKDPEKIFINHGGIPVIDPGVLKGFQHGIYIFHGQISLGFHQDLFGFINFLADRNQYFKQGSSFGTTKHRDLSMVFLYQVPGEGQTNTRTDPGRLVFVGNLVKAVENMGKMFLRNPWSAVRYGHLQPLSVCFADPNQRENDFSLNRCVLECVGEQIIEDLLHLICIKIYQNRR